MLYIKKQPVNVQDEIGNTVFFGQLVGFTMINFQFITEDSKMMHILFFFIFRPLTMLSYPKMFTIIRCQES